MKRVHSFCLQICLVTFLILRRFQLVSYERTYVFMYSVPRSCHTLMQLQFSRQILEKCSYRKFHVNLSCGNLVFRRGRRDMMKLIVAFRRFANAPEICSNYAGEMLRAALTTCSFPGLYYSIMRIFIVVLIIKRTY
jgi:hypothetical protein